MWVERPTIRTSVCPLCEELYNDKLKHIVAGCAHTLSSRDEFIANVEREYSNCIQIPTDPDEFVIFLFRAQGIQNKSHLALRFVKHAIWSYYDTLLFDAA